MTKHAGVIGHPLGHSISPVIFAAAFRAAGIDATYVAWETASDVLEGRITALRGTDFLGANVTIPHKQAVMPFLDETTELATRVGAVNTIVHRDDKLVGHNTDVAGFTRSLRDDAKFDAKGRRTMIIGAGGAARAIALALVEAGAAVIFVVGRQPRKTEGLVLNLKPITPSGTTITWAYLGDGAYRRSLKEADLLVNCTPVGVLGSETAGESIVPADLIEARTLVFDVVYNPAETPLLIAAKSRGAKAVSGIGMLVYQAAESFKLWTGVEADTTAMFAAAKLALGAKG